MIRLIALFLYTSLMAGCDIYQYAFSGDALINDSENEFFILRYSAYKECDIGGTLNEFAIRNNSKNELVVEHIELNMLKNGVSLNSFDTPKIYNNMTLPLRGAESANSTLQPGEWKYFYFPINDCNAVSKDDILNYIFKIKIKAGDKFYSSEKKFIKSVTKSKKSWL